MTAFLTSMGLVVLAEMGDKTQLLVMCYAAKYRWQTVLLAAVAATLVNFFLAALLGNYLTLVVPIKFIKIAASAAFIAFGLWTLKGAGDEEAKCEAKPSVNPFIAVAVAFTVAELGDKTQLSTVALSAKYHAVVPVWLGASAGMVIADAAGIMAGAVMGRKLPERAIKWIAAAVFILFGIAGLYEASQTPFNR